MRLVLSRIRRRFLSADCPYRQTAIRRRRPAVDEQPAAFGLFHGGEVL